MATPELTAELGDGDIVALKRDGVATHLMPLEVYDELRNWSPTKGRMDLNEFVNEGYLHELNRQFLHPLVLVLALIVDHLVGMAFGADTLSAEKAARIAEITAARRLGREAGLGYWVQPLPGETP